MHENYCNYLKCAESGIFYSVEFENYCFVSENPTKLLRNNECKLHSTEEAAAQFADGHEQHYLHGIFFNKELWAKVVNPEVAPEDILSLENIEQRMAALKVVGASKTLETMKAKEVDSQHGYKLYEVRDFFEDFPKAYFLRYSCPSTGREYLSGIDPEVGKNKNALTAIAHKFGLTAQDFTNIPKENMS